MKLFNLVKKYWFLIAVVLFSLTPLVWFWGKDSSILVNGLDTNFPLNPTVWFTRRFFVWNNIVNAGSDFSSSVSGLFFHLVQTVPYLAGFSLRWVEIFSLIFWFSAIVFSSLTLAKVVVPKNKVAQLVFVAVYSFNTYLFNTWENIKVSNLALYISLPLFVAIIYLLSKRLITTSRAVLYFSLTSILASGAGINPAYFSVIVLTIFITCTILALVGAKDRAYLQVVRSGFLAVLALFLVNLYWILPLVNNLISQKTTSLGDIGLTDWLKSLSENTSLLNVMRLQGAWDWYALNEFGMPQYLPYTLNYLYKIPFVIYSFVFPALALLSLFFFRIKEKHWYFLFGTLVILGIFLGAGAHDPTGGLYLFLSKQVPFFSFFRSPWYIFTPILLLAYAGLTGLLFDADFEFPGLRRKKLAAGLLKVLGLGFIVTNLFYTYPLVSGKIFRPGRPDSFYVAFPDYVWQARDWLNQSKEASSRIITYSEDQLESFTWGYRGTESILNLFSKREVITPSFNIQSKTLSTILSEFYSLLRKENYESALALLRFVGADTIFVKNDASTIFPAIKEGINRYIDSTVFGEWVFMKSKESGSKKIFIPSLVYLNYANEDDFVYAASILNDNSIVVNGLVDTEVNKIEKRGSFPVFVRAYNEVTKGLSDGSQIALSEKGENFDIDNVQKYYFSLPKEGIFTVAIESYKLGKEDVSVQLDRTQIAHNLLREGKGFILVGPLEIEKGNHSLTIQYPYAENILVGEDYATVAKESGLRQEEMPADITRTLVAYNPADSDKKIAFRLKNFDPYLKYAVGFEYKYLYGSVPLVDIIQSAPAAPVKTFPIYPGGAPDWEKQAYAFVPVPTDSKVGMFIKMSPNKPGDRSKTYFENIFFRRIYDNKVFLIEDAKKSKTGPETSFIQKSPVKYGVTVKNAPEDGYVLAFLESYNPNWSLQAQGVKSSAFPHFKINGYANGWFIPRGVGAQSFTLYYKPQKLFNLGALISLATIAAVLGLNVARKRRG